METGYAIGLLFLAAAVVALGLYSFCVLVWFPRRCLQCKLERQKEEKAAEEYRISWLPKLDTKFLLRMPDNVSKHYYSSNPARGIFGMRYNRVAIIDRDGTAWVGLLTPSIIASLRDAEYKQVSIWVPFCGPGEAYGGQPVTIRDITIDIYPLWLTTPQQISGSDWDKRLGWEKWVLIGENAKWCAKHPLDCTAWLNLIYPSKERVKLV